MANIDVRQRKMSFNQSRQTFVAIGAAVIGAIIWTLGISLTIASYNHSNTTPFSCSNHFISELGFPGTSCLAWLFNATEALGSLMSLPIVYLLGKQLHSRLGYVATGFGWFTFLILSGIGTLGLIPGFLYATHVPFGYLIAHNDAFLIFFVGWWVTVTLFTIAFCRYWQNRASRPLAVAGMMCWLVSLLLGVSGVFALQHLKGTQGTSTNDPIVRVIFDSQASPQMINAWTESHRPHVSWPAIMEWGLLGSVFLWHGLALVFIWMKTREASE